MASPPVTTIKISLIPPTFQAPPYLLWGPPPGSPILPNPGAALDVGRPEFITHPDGTFSFNLAPRHSSSYGWFEPSLNSWVHPGYLLPPAPDGTPGYLRKVPTPEWKLRRYKKGELDSPEPRWMEGHQRECPCRDCLGMKRAAWYWYTTGGDIGFAAKKRWWKKEWDDARAMSLGKKRRPEGKFGEFGIAKGARKPEWEVTEGERLKVLVEIVENTGGWVRFWYGGKSEERNRRLKKVGGMKANSLWHGEQGVHGETFVILNCGCLTTHGHPCLIFSSCVCHCRTHHYLELLHGPPPVSHPLPPLTPIDQIPASMDPTREPKPGELLSFTIDGRAFKYGHTEDLETWKREVTSNISPTKRTVVVHEVHGLPPPGGEESSGRRPRLPGEERIWMERERERWGRGVGTEEAMPGSFPDWEGVDGRWVNSVRMEGVMKGVEWTTGMGREKKGYLEDTISGLGEKGEPYYKVEGGEGASMWDWEVKEPTKTTYHPLPVSTDPAAAAGNENGYQYQHSQPYSLYNYPQFPPPPPGSPAPPVIASPSSFTYPQYLSPPSGDSTPPAPAPGPANPLGTPPTGHQYSVPPGTWTYPVNPANYPPQPPLPTQPFIYPYTLPTLQPYPQPPPKPYPYTYPPPWPIPPAPPLSALTPAQIPVPTPASAPTPQSQYQPHPQHQPLQSEIPEGEGRCEQPPQPEPVTMLKIPTTFDGTPVTTTTVPADATGRPVWGLMTGVTAGAAAKSVVIPSPPVVVEKIGEKGKGAWSTAGLDERKREEERKEVVGKKEEDEMVKNAIKEMKRAEEKRKERELKEKLEKVKGVGTEPVIITMSPTFATKTSAEKDTSSSSSSRKTASTTTSSSSSEDKKKKSAVMSDKKWGKQPVGKSKGVSWDASVPNTSSSSSSSDLLSPWSSSSGDNKKKGKKGGWDKIKVNVHQEVVADTSSSDADGGWGGDDEDNNGSGGGGGGWDSTGDEGGYSWGGDDPKKKSSEGNYSWGNNATKDTTKEDYSWGGDATKDSSAEDGRFSWNTAVGASKKKDGSGEDYSWDSTVGTDSGGHRSGMNDETNEDTSRWSWDNDDTTGKDTTDDDGGWGSYGGGGDDGDGDGDSMEVGGGWDTYGSGGDGGGDRSWDTCGDEGKKDEGIKFSWD